MAPITEALLVGFTTVSLAVLLGAFAWAMFVSIK
jgi:hypothetical protein